MNGGKMILVSRRPALTRAPFPKEGTAVQAQLYFARFQHVIDRFPT